VKSRVLAGDGDSVFELTVMGLVVSRVAVIRFGLFHEIAVVFLRCRATLGNSFNFRAGEVWKSG